jgi:hypothetical protein
MGYELPAASRGYDLTQIERDWTMAQARIDALAEAGTQAIHQLLQDTLERAERPLQRLISGSTCKPCRIPAVTTSMTWQKPFDPTGVALSHLSSPLLVSTTAHRTDPALPRPA